MPRVIFPPFQHKSGSTELEHALDARRLDEAFSELAGVLNGGIDESSLGSAVRFSLLAGGGVSVGTAVALKNSLMTFSFTSASPAGTSVVIGYPPGVNLYLVEARFFAKSSSASSVSWSPQITDGTFTTTCVDRVYTFDGASYTLQGTYPASDFIGTMSRTAPFTASMPTACTYFAISATFRTEHVT